MLKTFVAHDVGFRVTNVHTYVFEVHGISKNNIRYCRWSAMEDPLRRRENKGVNSAYRGSQSRSNASMFAV